MIQLAGYKGVDFASPDDIPEEEAKAYIERGLDKYGDNLYEVQATLDDEGYVKLAYYFKTNVPFERIRRITGYLVGTTERFNDAKRAEERDRVKHSL